MDFGIVVEILLALLGIVVMVIGWYLKDTREQIGENKTRIREVDEKIDQHKLYAAENFTTKRDLKEMVAGLVEHLRRIEDKLDRKVDK